MSLNGLDDPKVKEAHEAAAAEPGGWFLLKYASRDEIELLGRGNGGIVEIRNNISQYEETSPLFGFLRYRRRNVLIKYLPDDCSRLIQARLTVHFNAVCERFAPYNTTFSISTAKELKDTKLSAACSLHAASGSTSSSTSSLRRRRLMEIAEEEEEEQRAVKRSSTVLEDEDGDSDTDRPKSPDSPPVTLNSGLAAQPEERNFSPSTDPPDFVGIARPTSPAQSMDNGRRMSSQTARPDLYSYNSYTYGKPKVKLGPRPSLEAGSRPKTAAGTFRPVSQMPSGFKMYNKGTKRIKAGDDRELADQSDPTELAFPIVNNTGADSASIMTSDDASAKSPTSPGRPATSSGVSLKSPVTQSFPASAKNTITPEKARLMRAMQLREKRKKASMQPIAVDANAEDEPPEVMTPNSETAYAAAVPLPSLPEEEEKRLSTIKSEEEEEAAEAAPENLQADHSESARSDSRPDSPLDPSSEHDQSTKASSLSESTDETVKDGEAEKESGEPSATQPAKEDSEVESEPDNEEDQTLVADAINTSEPEHAEEASMSPTIESTEQQKPAEVEREFESLAEAPHDDAAPVTKEVDSVDVTEGVAEIDEGLNKPTEEPSEPEEPIAQLETKEEQETAEQGVSERPLTPPVSKFSNPDAMSPSKMTPTRELPGDGNIANTPSQVTASPASPHRGIPTSKFSTNSPASKAASVPTIVSPAAEATDEFESRPATDYTDGAESIQEKPKRRTIEPIRTDIKTPPADGHLSDDEELMDELQSATVEQAKPMLVSKSPISPAFPSSSPAELDDKGTPRVVRTISNPIRGNLLTPSDVAQNSARSVSSGAAYLHKITQQQTSSRENLAPKNGKLGSRISQRIKALEMLSVNAPGEGPSRSNSTRSNAPSATFFSVGKNREPSRSPSVAERTTSLSRRSPQRTNTAISDTQDSSPESRVPRGRSGSMASRLSMFEGMPAVPPTNTMPRGRPETISVTARIIRDPSEAGKQEPPKDPSEFVRLDLKQSPLEVNHQRAQGPSPPSVPTATLQERRMSRETRRSASRDRDEDEDKGRRSSLSIVRDFIKDRRKSLTSGSGDILSPPSVMSPKSSPSRPPSTHNNGSSSFPRRLSISSRRSSISKDVGALSPTSVTEASSGDDSKSTKSDKKKSRAGRFMRRLSSSISSSLGKNMTPTAISPTVKEEDLADLGELHPAQPSVQYMGDVNVQFPDNLLWKRRTLGLDSQGFLILSLSASNAGTKDKPATGVKRYHLSEFRTPYTPDVEVQELPNSVVLDLIEGSGLQMACEDRAGQTELLHTLLEAHQNHTSFGQ